PDAVLDGGQLARVRRPRRVGRGRGVVGARRRVPRRPRARSAPPAGEPSGDGRAHSLRAPPMTRVLVAAIRRLAHLFYRRVEATGLGNVPAAGPVLFVANHVNGLVDPMVVLAVLDRPIVFVAK